MRDVSDQFVKNLLRDALNLATTADTEVEVLGSTQKIDVYSEPDPAREAMRAEMGLLGELAAERSLFEPFHDTPGVPHFRRCIRKQLAWHHELERRARVAAGQRSDDAESEARAQVQFPALVIVSPGRPESALAGYRCEV